ncbi:MAG: hypothetical protein ACJ0BR_05490 [Candidatus Puniceispirillales bacterium]|mgnify:FL=1|jgi:hypothetical protein
MQKLEMLIKTVDAHYDSLHQIQCFYLSCSLLNIARGTCNMMIVSEDSDFKNKITIKFERAIMSGSIQVTNNFFNSLQNQLSVKNERPARLELVINDKLNINKNGILFLEQELTSDIIEYKFFIPVL